MIQSGAYILLEIMRREGVDVLFGYPGGAVIDIYNELTSHTALEHILVRHEQGAVHAADGYARATGKVGVCLLTSGPGATNAVTGIATANSDSVPMVIITGQVPTSLIGNDSFQEVDIVGITRPCTKHNYLVKDIKDLAGILRQAFYLARSGRPGPVLVDIPKDIVQAKAEYVWPEDVHMRSYNPTMKPNLQQIKRAGEALLQSKRPLILCGGGVIGANACAELAQLAESMHIPVVGSLMGLGAFSALNELWFGMIGMHGSYAGNKAINTADCIVAIGTRFDDRITCRLEAFAPNAHIIHIDIDPTSIRKIVNVRTPIVCDCKVALNSLLEFLASHSSAAKNWQAEHAEWVDTLKQWHKEHPMCYVDEENVIKPQQVIQAIHEIAGVDAIITTEVGQHQMWTAQFYPFVKPRTLLTSGGLGTMGFGMPAAIGAKKGIPDALVITIAGDGSIQMNIQELATAVANKLPIKIVILNNGYLGMVRQWQELFYDKNYSGTDMTGQPDFVELAEAYGAEGYRIEKKEDIHATLRKAFASPNVAIVDVRIAREENVYPMVPAGAAVDEMLLV